jgi:hypothetical protein
MPQDQPGAGDVHVDGLLTNISVAYKNEDYIANDIFPTVMVEKQSDLIAGYDKGDWLRSVMQPYTPGTIGAQSGYRVDHNRSYFCQGFKLGKVLPDDVVKNADNPFNMYDDATAWLKEQAQLRLELQFATNFFADGKGWQDKVAGTDFVAFSNYAGSDPIHEIRVKADLIRQKTGRKMNTALYSQQVWNQLADHPIIVDRIKHTSKDSVTPEVLARLVGYDRTLIGSAIYTATTEGVTPVISEVWGKHILLAHVAPRPSLMMPTAGYTFFWRPITNTPFYFRRRRDEGIESTVLEIKSFNDMKMIDGDNGVFLKDAVA